MIAANEYLDVPEVTLPLLSSPPSPLRPPLPVSSFLRPSSSSPSSSSSSQVLDAKVALLASLLKQSRHTCAYTGAGLSQAAGIPDYATKAAGSVTAQTSRVRSPYDAQPT